MAEPNRVRINIASIGRPLVRVTYGGGETTLEANLSEAAATEAIAEAMLRLARGAGQEDKARLVTDTFRSHGVDVREYADAIGRMCSQLFASMIAAGLQDIDVDLEAWSVTTSAISPASN